MSNTQNIETILKDFGLEIPENRKEDFHIKFHENYKTVSDYGKLETDRDSWKQKTEEAENTLKSFEGINLEEVQQELADWKKKAEEAEKNAQAQLYERDFADALRAETENIKFSSEAAKRDVLSQIKAAELKLKDGKILGLSDLIAQIKESDAAAFVNEQQEQLEANKARFTQPVNPRTLAPGTKVSPAELMRMKNENPNLDISQYI